MNSEIGRVLLASELVPRTVYVLRKEGRDPVATFWFVGLDGGMAHFYSGTLGLNLILFVQPDGTLRDETAAMTIYQYLGDV